MDLTKLGILIRDRRKQLGLTAAAVAKSVGISRAYLSILEAGRNPKSGKPSKPSLEVLAMISKALDLDPATTMALAGYPPALIAFLHPTTGSPRPGEEAIWALEGRIEGVRRDLRSLGKPGPRASRAETPSGIPHLKVQPDEHILVLSDSESGRDYSLALEFAAAGMKEGQSGIVRLPPSVSARLAERRISTRRGRSALRRILFVPWAEGVLPHYEPHRFSREGTIAAHRKDLTAAQRTGANAIRFATPDASDYFAWVENPEDVLQYENVWPSDLQAIAPDAELYLLCLYRFKDLRKQQRPGFSVPQMVLSLLQSHSRVVLLTRGDTLFTDREAARALLARLDLNGVAPGDWNRVRMIGDKYHVWEL